jgi:hypothetical protein
MNRYETWSVAEENERGPVVGRMVAEEMMRELRFLALLAAIAVIAIGALYSAARESKQLSMFVERAVAQAMLDPVLIERVGSDSGRSGTHTARMNRHASPAEARASIPISGVHGDGILHGVGVHDDGEWRIVALALEVQGTLIDLKVEGQ